LNTQGRPADGNDVFEVPAGTDLQLNLTIAFRVDVERATVGVIVRDLARQLYVYGASSESIGMPLIRARAGDVRSFAFTFEVNLTRGLYAIEVNVADIERQRFLAIARGIRHFNVVEDVTYDGIANLYLAGRETGGIHRLLKGRAIASNAEPRR
jgi:hypothetical protein